MYVKLDLADPKFCTGCACLYWAEGGTPEEHPYCRAFDTTWGRWDVKASGMRGVIRPQACIDASAEIEKLVAAEGVLT